MINDSKLIYIYNGKTHTAKYRYNSYINLIKQLYYKIKSIF